MWGRKRASMVFFLNSLPQCSTKAESSMVTTSTSSNQVLMVVGASCCDICCSTLPHTSVSEFKVIAPLSQS